jgi:HK97 family phage prohead protease
MNHHRAHSHFVVRSFDEDLRELVGIATTPTPDHMGDIVEPKGARFHLPIPLLWQHQADQPLGHVTAAHVTNSGIEVRAKILRIDEPGRLKDRLDEAWQAIKSVLVKGLSIGFSALEPPERLPNGGSRFASWLWHELSAVTIPANGGAAITATKSYSGTTDVVRLVRRQPSFASDGRRRGCVYLHGVSHLGAVHLGGRR